jgi:hypothetical protein
VFGWALGAMLALLVISAVIAVFQHARWHQ